MGKRVIEAEFQLWFDEWHLTRKRKTKTIEGLRQREERRKRKKTRVTVLMGGTHAASKERNGSTIFFFAAFFSVDSFFDNLRFVVCFCGDLGKQLVMFAAQLPVGGFRLSFENS